MSWEHKATAEPLPKGNSLPCCGNSTSPLWACIYTHPQAERWADFNLRSAGYVTCLPMMLVRRRDRVVKTMWHTVAIPAFSRYLFVRGPIRWGTLKEIPGICDVLKNGSEVAYTPDAVVERLKALKELPAPQSGWTVGAPCRLATGPLRGHSAVILSVSRDSATLAVLILGALRTVNASLDALALREADDDHPNSDRSSDAARIR